MRRVWIGALVLAVPVGWLAMTWQQESGRRGDLFSALEHGDHLEQNQRWAEAVQVYRAALELPLEDDERADVRYRLARVQIEGNDLNGALGVLQDLTSDDVAVFQIDIGPLYFRLADRAREAGNLPLAMIANRLGTAVSPARMEQFMGQRESIANDARASEASPTDGPGDGEAEGGG